MKKVLLAIFASALALTAFVGCNEKKNGGTAQGEQKAEPKKMVLRYSELHPQDYPTTQAAYKFAEMVEEKTGGRIHIEVYHGGQLGDEKSVVEQVQFGAIDFTRVSVTVLSEFEKSLNILSLPYLYKDADQMWRVLDGEIGDKFLSKLEPSNFVGLSWFDGGSRNFYTHDKVTKLEDLKGKKIRVQESQLMMEMVAALGASATPMPYGEIYSGLQTGIIDGAENNFPSYESASHYEVAKNFVLDEHTRTPEVQFMSKVTWDKLSADDQKIIMECAKESAKVERELWAAKEKASEDKVVAAGVSVNTLEDGEKEKFQAAMTPIYAKFGAGYEDLIKQIQEK